MAKLRQAEALAGQGKPVMEAVRAIGVAEVTHYPLAPGVWRAEAGPGEAAEALGAGEPGGCGARWLTGRWSSWR